MKQTFEIHTRFSFLKITPVIIILSIILTSLLLTGTTLYGQRRNPNVSSPAALGGIDTTFAPRLERAGVIEKMLPQADGKIVFTGSFDKIGNAERKNIARLNADGTLDAALNLPENIFLNSLEPLPDGKFIALATGGAIVRLNPDGSLDYSFNFARTITNPASVSFKARSDGKVFVYGKFKVKRKNSVIAENLIVLDEIGGIESGYTVGAFGSIGNVIFLPDGKTAVCGLFEVKRDGMTVGRNFAVLDEHGLIDRNFDVVFDAGSFGNSETVISVAVQPDGKLLVYGFFKTASKEGGLLRSVSKNKGIVRLNADGTFDRDFSLPFVSAAVGQAIVQPDGKIILYGGLQLTPGVNTKFISRLFPDGSLDNLFNDNMPLTAEFSFGGTSEVRLQPDGKILVRGHYRVNNSPNVEKLVRLNADGTHDSSFQTSNILGGWVLGFRNLPDGKILISGNFGKIGSRTRIGLARLNADGSTDENFRLDVVKSGVEVKTLNLQPDGKIIIAGDFTVVGGEYIYNAELANSALPSSIGVVVRLNQDGSVDNSFVPFTNVFDTIFAITLQPDGKILISGTLWNSGISTYIARLNPDGTIDASFNRTLFFQSNPYPQIYDMAVQPDGKILVGGYFSQIGQFSNPPQYKLARLMPDGTLDATFGYSGYYQPIESIRRILVQPDGKFLVGGVILGYAGNAPGLARFNRDGTLDAAFKWNRDLHTADTYDLQVQPDGKILFAGMMGIGAPGNVLPPDLYRLNRNGEVETRFNLSQVTKFLLQADGKIVAQAAGQPAPGVRLRRVFSDGIADNTFDFALDRPASKLVQQTDGKILLAGSFTTIDGIRQNGLARLNP